MVRHVETERAVMKEAITLTDLQVTQGHMKKQQGRSGGTDNHVARAFIVVSAEGMGGAG